MRREKCNDHVEFPMTINMEPYTVGYIEGERGRRRRRPPAPPLAATPAAHGFEYTLVGVLVHTGTTESGHYYSFVRERRVPTADGGEGGGGWLHLNDQRRAVRPA